MSYSINYRPQRSWGEVMFLHMSVILFMGGGSASVHTGIPTPEQTISPQEETRKIFSPPRKKPGRPPQEESPPKAVHTGRYGQQVGGTHPTGIHTCYNILLFTLV